jgi:hypothetical protein
MTRDEAFQDTLRKLRVTSIGRDRSTLMLEYFRTHVIPELPEREFKEERGWDVLRTPLLADLK